MSIYPNNKISNAYNDAFRLYFKISIPLLEKNTNYSYLMALFVGYLGLVGFFIGNVRLYGSYNEKKLLKRIILKKPSFYQDGFFICYFNLFKCLIIGNK